MASDGWIGSTTIHVRGDRSRRGYHGFKTYTYVTRAAAPRTTIRVLAPTDALLFYTPGSNWNSGLTHAEEIAGATTSVTLHGCRSDLTGYAGELLLKKPGCVTLDFRGRGAGAETDQRLRFPMGKSC